MQFHLLIENNLDPVLAVYIDRVNELNAATISRESRCSLSTLSYFFDIKGRKKILWLNKVQYASNAYVELPIRIGPEESRDFLFERNMFAAELKHFVEIGTLKANKRLTVMVKDSLGDEYTHKARIKIKDIIKNV